MAYELFRREAVIVGSPMLAITPTGRIVVNAAGCRILKEAALKRVVLLWDRVGRKMAVKGAPKGEKHAFTLTFNPGSASLSAVTFLRYIGWHAPLRVTLPASWNEPNKMFEVVLPSKHLHSGAGDSTRKDRSL
jgi:hypothetical protein